jgi:LuxR family maltose regulon positive regulatory protein
MDPARRMDLAYFRFQEASVLLLQNRDREAAAAAADAVAIGRASGLPALQIPHFLIRQALCLVRLREIEPALALYREAISRSTGLDRRNFEFHEALIHAYQHWRDGAREEAVARLRTLFPACREASYFGFLRQSPEVIAPLFVLALEQGIEPDYVRALIRQRKLPPPSPDIPDWPWPLALRTLGEFAISRDGQPLVSKGKAQKKPLELLKALIAHGGRGADAAMLTALVWPDAEGDDAKTSFDSNLYRLRKLLNADGALQLSDGKLSLNPDLVWLDVWAFEAALEEGRTDAALALYRGHFLVLDAAPPWALATRDRLQAKLIRAVLAAGGAYEERREWARARALYERALDLDNLAESVYRRLMVCQRELGDPAGALTTYRRCRELLSIVLNRPPAAETEVIRQSLA